jgi:hypothetical protein
MLAIYAMGASGKLLREGYRNDEALQRPLGKSPGPISDNNFADHLGDESYYQAYLEFFSNELVTKGVDKTLGNHLYCKDANFNNRVEADGSRHPEMFARFMSGLMHPLIHVGYGLEFGLPGILAEGTSFWVHPMSVWNDSSFQVSLYLQLVSQPCPPSSRDRISTSLPALVRPRAEHLPGSIMRVRLRHSLGTQKFQSSMFWLSWLETKAWSPFQPTFRQRHLLPRLWKRSESDSSLTVPPPAADPILPGIPKCGLWTSQGVPTQINR